MTAHGQEGSFRQHPRRPGCWIVNLGGGTYECDLSGTQPTCTCRSFQFRGFCKHLRALAGCPACGGFGDLALREKYPGPPPPCLVCDGTGLRSHADASLLASFEARREQALKELFR